MTVSLKEMAEEMPEENLLRVPDVKHNPTLQDWEDEIIDAPHDTPRKAIWVPMDMSTRHWYISRERSVHNLVNTVLRSYMESETTKGNAPDSLE